MHAKVQATGVLLLRAMSLFTIVNIRGYHRDIITLLILKFTVKNSVLLSSRGCSREGDQDEATALVSAATAAYDGAKQQRDRRSRAPDTNPIPP